jgi:hypothetical protein
MLLLSLVFIVLLVEFPGLYPVVFDLLDELLEVLPPLLLVPLEEVVPLEELDVLLLLLLVVLVLLELDEDYELEDEDEDDEPDEEEDEEDDEDELELELEELPLVVKEQVEIAEL